VNRKERGKKIKNYQTKRKLISLGPRSQKKKRTVTQGQTKENSQLRQEKKKKKGRIEDQNPRSKEKKNKRKKKYDQSGNKLERRGEKNVPGVSCH